MASSFKWKMWLKLFFPSWDRHRRCTLSSRLDFWAFGKKSLLLFGLAVKSGWCCWTQSSGAHSRCVEFCSAVTQFINSSWQWLGSKRWKVCPFGKVAALPGRDTSGFFSNPLSGKKAALVDLCDTRDKRKRNFLRFIKANSSLASFYVLCAWFLSPAVVVYEL